jgi:hypothetical protein
MFLMVLRGFFFEKGKGRDEGRLGGILHLDIKVVWTHRRSRRLHGSAGFFFFLHDARRGVWWDPRQWGMERDTAHQREVERVDTEAMGDVAEEGGEKR